MWFFGFVCLLVLAGFVVTGFVVTGLVLAGLVCAGRTFGVLAIGYCLLSLVSCLFMSCFNRVVDAGVFLVLGLVCMGFWLGLSGIVRINYEWRSVSRFSCISCVLLLFSALVCSVSSLILQYDFYFYTGLAETDLGTSAASALRIKSDLYSFTSSSSSSSSSHSLSFYPPTTSILNPKWPLPLVFLLSLNLLSASAPKRPSTW